MIETAHPIGLVLSPPDLRMIIGELQVHPEAQELLQGINQFFASLGLEARFTEAELLRDPVSGIFLLQSPAKLTAVSYAEDGKLKIAHVSTDQIFREGQLLAEGLADRELEPLKQAIDLGNGYFMVTLAVKFGLPLLGEKPDQKQNALFSMIVRAEKQKQQPTLLFGHKDELNQKLAYEDKIDHSLQVRFSQQVYGQLDALIGQAEQLHGGKFARFHKSLIDDNSSNIEGVEFWAQNGNFFGVVTLHMVEDDRHFQRSFVLNKGRLEEGGELLQASNFIVSTTIDGEPAVAVAKQNRINGNFAQQGEIALELLRGFDNGFFAKGKKFLVEEESGLSSEMILRHITAQLKLREDAKLGSVVTGRLLMIELLPDTDFALENKRAENPAAKVEDLVPSWIKLSDILDLVKKGETFVDAHSLAMLAVWVARSNLVQMKDGVKDTALVFEQYQDLIDGQNYLTLPRTANEGIWTNQELAGAFNGNSGAAHMSNKVVLAIGMTEDLSLVDGSLMVLTMSEIWQKIVNSEFDNVTMASIFKFLVQQDLLVYQKPAS